MNYFIPTREQLTAYALNESRDAERDSITRYLATDPKATDEVVAIRETANLLRAAFQTGRQPTLDPARRATLARLAKTTASQATAGREIAGRETDGRPTCTPIIAAKRRYFPHRIVWPAALAAGLVIGVALPHHREAQPVPMASAEVRSGSELHPVAPATTISQPNAQVEFAQAGLNTPTSDVAEVSAPSNADREWAKALGNEEAVASESAGTSGAFMAIGRGGGGRIEADLPATATAPVRAEAPQDDTKRRSAAAIFGSRSGGGIPPHLSDEKYAQFVENGWHRVSTAADDRNRRSTLGADVDIASYANVRRMLNDGHLPPTDAVRLEEMLNAMPYSYQPPRTHSTPFAVYPEVGTAPWDSSHRLVRIAVQGYALDAATRPPANIVFLIDVSGSMNQPNKLPLVQRALSMLTAQLRNDDRVAIVTYAGNTGIRLESTSGEHRDQILAAIAGLSAAGGTNGAGGITTAYAVAKRSFIEHGVNRVVLCTDGDFNVGVNSRDGLERLIASEAKSNVFLTVLGFGMGNYKDTTLQILADKGNGQYAYIDTEAEARKQLVDGCTGMLVTIAKDVKIQVEFNPTTVAEWRLLGYEKRHLAQQDFLDDSKDGGEIGAGHALTAVYEIVPRGNTHERVPPLRYASDGQAESHEADSLSEEPISYETALNELLTISLRWKLPDGERSNGLSIPISDNRSTRPSADFAFATAVIEFAQVLRHSSGTWSLDRALSTAQATAGTQPQRQEFIDLVRKAQQLGAR